MQPIEKSLTQALPSGKSREPRLVTRGHQPVERRGRIAYAPQDDLAVLRIGAVEPQRNRYEFSVGQRERFDNERAGEAVMLNHLPRLVGIRLVPAKLERSRLVKPTPVAGLGLKLAYDRQSETGARPCES